MQNISAISGGGSSARLKGFLAGSHRGLIKSDEKSRCGAATKPLWGMWRWRRADNVLDYKLRTCVIFIFSQGRPSNMTERIGLQGRYPFPLC